MSRQLSLSILLIPGALVAFAANSLLAVQITMMVAAIRSGERLSFKRWIGLGLAIGGLTYLVLPGLTAPAPVGALLMALSGIAWGVYTLRGRGSVAPLVMTAGNFTRAAPLGIGISGVSFA